MTASELKREVEAAGHDSHFFTHRTMRFFGDTMRNYGVRSAVIITMYNASGEYDPGQKMEVWELYRKSPVRHGLTESAYFSKATFRRVFPQPAA